MIIIIVVVVVVVVAEAAGCTPNLPTNIVDFGGFDSSIIFISRGGIPRSTGNFPESLSQAMLVGTMIVGRLGVIIITIRMLL